MVRRTLKENMVKKIEEKVKELVEGKKQNIELHLYEEYGLPHKVVTHEDIAGYQLNGDWVAVMEKNGTSHIYPASRVQYVKHFTVE